MAKEVKLYDYDTEEESLKRRQAILDAMRQSASQPLDLVQAGGMSAAPGLGSVLGKLGQQFLAQYGDKKLKEERAGLAERSREDMRKGFENFYRTAEGYEAPSMAMAPGPDGKPVMQKVPGDKRRAIFEALASGHPVLRQFAMQQLEQESKGWITAKDLLGIAAPTSVFENPNDPSKWRGKRDIGEVGGTIYDKDRLETVQLGGAKPSQAVFNGDLYEVSPSTGQWKKLDNAPKISTSVSVGGPVIQGENSFMKGIGEDTSKLVNNARLAKQAGQQMITVADKLERLQQSGVFSGPTANIATKVGALAETVGIPVDKSRIANSEEYQATLAGQVAKVLTAGAGVGRSMTDEDRKAFERQFPQLINTPAGMSQIIGLLRQNAARDINYSQAVEQNLQQHYPEAARLFNIAPSNLPYPVEPAQQAVPQVTPPISGSGRPVIKWGELK